MARGGKREGAGRPVVNKLEKSEKFLDTLLIPAFSEALANESRQVTVGIKDLEAAFGRQGVEEFKTWFSIVRLGSGIGGHSAIATVWELKLKLAIAAQKMVAQNKAEIDSWPTKIIKDIRNRRAYDLQKEKYEIAVAAIEEKHEGYAAMAFSKFDPLVDYTIQSTEFVCNDKSPRAGLTNGTRGWAEMITGGNNGFIGPTSEIIIQSTEIPF